MKLLICIWQLSSSLALLQINEQCLSVTSPVEHGEIAIEEEAMHHMWQASRPVTAWQPTILQPAADSQVAAGDAIETHPVCLANYIYQCATKRAASPLNDLDPSKTPRFKLKQLESTATVDIVSNCSKRGQGLGT
ncbi:uncharacterized protein LOC116805792 [Drosophila grimshawi]|uniref:uncharacterized protein LOC116805792 n=1 Tax=Drosophila grimshawi TaxID=7222 RepID=UPI000C86E906|nr:uncharacterized protein LOC116805792 [Drosophila grimshawi]